MYLLNYSFPSAIENIAFDEAFLEWCEGADPGSVIRLWESPEVAVVLGHGNQIHREADPEACRKRQIPILRRCSGGGTVVVGPGCFQYSFFLRNDDSAQLQSIGGTTDFVMDHLACLLQQAAEDGVLKPDRIPPREQLTISRQGQSDLTLNGYKCSGNAQRRRRHYTLFHGTLLSSFPIADIAEILPHPSREPAYRENRSHASFLTNVGMRFPEFSNRIFRYFECSEWLQELPIAETQTLVRERYNKATWIEKF